MMSLCNIMESSRVSSIYYSNILRGGWTCCPVCAPTLSSLAFSPECCQQQPAASSSVRPNMIATFRNIVRLVSYRLVKSGVIL